MNPGKSTPSLNLLAGEVVEVRSKEEILATLDETGRLGALPFMPEMFAYCGQRLRVAKRADKTCDNIGPPEKPQHWSLRRAKNMVHLTGTRCSGSAHGNCDAGCVLFWNEAWLKRPATDFVQSAELNGLPSGQPQSAETLPSGSRCSEEKVLQASLCAANGSDGRVYSCQATDLRKFTSHLNWWDIRQYLRDIRSGNLRRGFGTAKSEEMLENLLGVLEVFRSLLITFFNRFQSLRSGVQYPHIQGSVGPTSTEEIHLQPGELVQVRSKEDIVATLDHRNKNRGLLFDSEMVKYCGGTFRVLKRVNQIIDEKNGKMVRMKSPCIILDGVSCAADYHWFCPRAIYHYWRESWLRRVQ